MTYSYYTMQVAHVLVRYENKDSQIPLDGLKQVEEIKEVNPTFGAFDAVLRIEANSKEKVNQVISDKIRKIDGIYNTVTLLNNTV